jgi:hypothetical protein
VALVGSVAVKEKCYGAWYVTDNRNKMLAFRDPSRDFTIELHRTGGCIVSASRGFQKHLETVDDIERFLARVERAFYDEILRWCGGDASNPKVMAVRGFKDALFWKRYCAWMNTFGVLEQHRLFRLLDQHHKFPPFRIEAYKEGGLVMYSDGSHPHDIEVAETVPSSLSKQMFDLNLRNAELLEALIEVERKNHEERLKSDEQTRQGILQYITVTKEQTTALTQLDQTLRDMIQGTKKPTKSADRRLFE